jgi:pimeloyl-ACP methyl ester carboxylesterase
MPTVRANGIDIYYETHGGGDATPLVLLHGMAGSSQQWLPATLPLAGKRPLILPDFRGHARSTSPEDVSQYSIPIYAADIAAFLDALGIERAHIGGQSLGGFTSAQLAVDFPEKCASVLLCDTSCGNGVDSGPCGDWERYVQGGIGLRGQRAQEFGLEESVRMEFEWRKENDPHFAESPYTLETYLDRMKTVTVHGYVGVSNAIVERPDLTDRIGAITAPALVMIGEWDGFYPCAIRDHALIPGARLVVRLQCGHGFKWRTDTWLAEIESFLSDVDAGRDVAGKREV